MIALLAGLAAAAPLTGVVAGPQGEPVGGVQVIAYDHRFEYKLDATDAAGRFALELPDGHYRIRVIPSQGSPYAENWMPGVLDICTAERVEVGEGLAPDLAIGVALGGAIEGVLVDDFGDPVPDAELVAYTLLTQPKAVPRRALTDADGRFAVRGLPADAGADGSFRLEVAADDRPTQFLGQVYSGAGALAWTVAPGEAADAGTHELLPGIAVSGRVDGPDGPILIGSVSAYSPSQLVSVDIVDGRYAAIGLPPGEVLTWARAPGFATTYLPDADRPDQRVAVPDEGASVDGLDIAMPLESRLSGRLVHDGAPVAGASVVLYNSDQTVGVSAVADADGGFVVEALHPGDYTLGIFASDEGFLDGKWTDAGGTPIPVVVPDGDGDVGAIELVPGARLVGRAVDPYTDQGVYGATITAQHRDTGATFVVGTERDGSYAIRGMVAGSWDVSASYTSWCDPDPDYLSVYFPNQATPTFAQPLVLAVGEEREWNPELAPDFDHDGMDDVWEAAHGLDPTRDDAAEDADGDGYTNLDEYLLGTDPSVAVRRECACDAGLRPVGAWWLLTTLSLLRRRR